MHGSAAARLLGSRVRIPLFVYSLCCVLVDGGLCDELIIRSEVSYRVYVPMYLCVI
jgi:hypothetical protein